MSNSQMQGITSKVYSHLKDDFDFIIVASNQRDVQAASYSGTFFNVKNDIGGIGKGNFDNTSLYGSSGRLQGAIHLISTDGLTGGPSLHEIAHHWANSMRSVPTAVGGHWGYANIGGQLGGWQPGSLEWLGGIEYRARNPRTGNYGSFGGFANGGNGLPYSSFELYVMGLIPPEQVATTSRSRTASSG